VRVERGQNTGASGALLMQFSALIRLCQFQQPANTVPPCATQVPCPCLATVVSHCPYYTISVVLCYNIRRNNATCDGALLAANELRSVVAHMAQRCWPWLSCVSAGLTRLLNASYNTAPEDTQGPFPVIVFSHG
jgi:hypothetical protein